MVQESLPDLRHVVSECQRPAPLPMSGSTRENEVSFTSKVMEERMAYITHGKGVGRAGVGLVAGTLRRRTSKGSMDWERSRRIPVETALRIFAVYESGSDWRCTDRGDDVLGCG